MNGTRRSAAQSRAQQRERTPPRREVHRVPFSAFTRDPPGYRLLRGWVVLYDDGSSSTEGVQLGHRAPFHIVRSQLDRSLAEDARTVRK